MLKAYGQCRFCNGNVLMKGFVNIAHCGFIRIVRKSSDI